MNKRYQSLKSRGSNRCLTPFPWGLRAAYAVHLCPVLPGTEFPATWRIESVEFFHRTFLVVSLLNRFGFHDETSVNGRKFLSTITRLMVDRTYVFHLLFLIYFLSKRVKKPLVLETLETNEVYLQRHRWFLHLRTSPKKKFSLPVVKSPVPFFSSRSSFFIIVAVSPSEVCIGGRPIPAVAHFFLLQSLNFAWWVPGVTIRTLSFNSEFKRPPVPAIYYSRLLSFDKFQTDYPHTLPGAPGYRVTGSVLF